jgi:branched-subunit amino acid ABC-type transport system permease component
MGTAALLDVVAGVLGFNALFRRSARAVGVERQQFKWFMAGVLLTFAVTVVGGTLLLNDSDLAKFVISNGVAAVPISVGVAILRYRLYDIDLFIKRTVVYGGTSVAIALTFFLGILALQALLRPLTAGSELAVAASTLGTLALLQPIRRRVQNAVDRRFDRARHDAARTIEAFAEQLRDEVDLDALRTDLLGTVQQTMAPAHSSLWLRPR